MSTQDVSEIRATAKGIIQRSIQDATFAEQLRSNPRETVLEAGLPEAVVDDFIGNDLGMESEVSGYGPCTYTCIVVTCDITVDCGESV